MGTKLEEHTQPLFNPFSNSKDTIFFRLFNAKRNNFVLINVHKYITQAVSSKKGSACWQKSSGHPQHSPQCRCHRTEAIFTNSSTHIGLLSQSFTASSRVKGCGHISIAGLNSKLTAYTYYGCRAARVVCPTVATVARIMHLNWERKENRTQLTAICDLLRFTGEILLTVPLNKASCVVFVFFSSLHLQGTFFKLYFLNMFFSIASLLPSKSKEHTENTGRMDVLTVQRGLWLCVCASWRWKESLFVVPPSTRSFRNLAAFTQALTDYCFWCFFTTILNLTLPSVSRCVCWRSWVAVGAAAATFQRLRGRRRRTGRWASSCQSPRCRCAGSAQTEGWCID